MGLRQRLEDLSARFREPPGGGAHGAAPVHALEEDYWQSVRDLFTRDVTGKDLRELVEKEPRDTLDFFTREIDFASLRRRRWYERCPITMWKVYLALAYRLSPPRRIVFAGAVPVLFLAWVGAAVARLTRGLEPGVPTALEWVLAAATLLFFLLVLELRDKLTLKGDLEVARQIQFGLLPFEPYRKDGLSVVSFMRPANTVGGDYFDLIELPEGGVAVAVGDVAGKGMPAALLMALLQGSLRTLLTAGLRGPELAAALNTHLCSNIPSNRLITLFYGELDLREGRLRYVNAGHNPPFLFRGDGAAERLAPTGLALGVVSAASFDAMETELLVGDRLFMYTDGITEAFNPQEEEYGEARLQAVLRRHRSSPASAAIEALIEEVLAFCGRSRPHDDMTLMVLGREA